MSFINTLDLPTDNRWLHMAGVMAHCLQSVIEKRAVVVGDIPKGLCLAAKEFFELLIQTVETEFPLDATVGSDVYLLATKTLGRGERRASKKKAVAPSSDRLQEVVEFVTGLQQPHQLTEHELEIGRQVRSLFAKMYLEGDREAYEKRVGLEFAACNP